MNSITHQTTVSDEAIEIVSSSIVWPTVITTHWQREYENAVIRLPIGTQNL